MSHEIQGQAGGVSRPHSEEKKGKPPGIKGCVSLSLCMCLSSNTGTSVSLAHGSTQLPPNDTFSPRIYKIVLEFLGVFFCNTQFVPKEIKRYTKNKSRSTWLSEKVFYCFSLFPSLDSREQRERDGKSDITSPLAVGLTCLDEGWSSCGWQDSFKHLSLSYRWVDSKVYSQNSEPVIPCRCSVLGGLF